MIQRIFTGLVLIGVTVTCVVLGSPYLIWYVLFGTLICAYELTDMCKKSGYSVNLPMVFIGIGVLFGWIYYVGDVVAIFQLIGVKSIVYGLLLLYVMEIFIKRVLLPPYSWLLAIRIIIFFCGTLIFVVILRQSPNGLFLLLVTCVLIWTSDTFAYFGGRLFGRHRLTSISPGKTIEGSISACVAVILCAVLISKLYGLDYGVYLRLACLVTIAAQLGDLHESLTKRRLNTKDSSGILPGHGGFYDRLDSAMFVLPMVFYFFHG